MKITITKCASLLLGLCFIFTMTACSDKKPADSTRKSAEISSEKAELISKEDAYKTYCGLIEKFVPDLMESPQESDIEITTHVEVTQYNEDQVSDYTVKAKSQNTDGKLQYYMLCEYSENDNMYFFCINDDKLYSANNILTKNRKLTESPVHLETIEASYLNVPRFEQDAIKSLKSEKSGSDTVMTFVVSGRDMGYDFTRKFMEPMADPIGKYMDDVTIILTIDKNGIPKTMSTKMSMSIYHTDDSSKLWTQKILDMDFVFNKLDDVDFDLKEVVSQYTSDYSVLK